MVNFEIPWDKKKEFVEALINSPSNLNEMCLEWFGVTTDQLSYQSLSYIDQRVFECECCQVPLSTEHCVQHGDENWCKWCEAEEKTEIAFSEGHLSIEEYTKRMNEIQQKLGA